jgi:hypothetical protein
MTAFEIERASIPRIAQQVKGRVDPRHPGGLGLAGQVRMMAAG